MMTTRSLVTMSLVIGLLLLLGAGLRGNPRLLPSVLVDKPAPAFDLPMLYGTPRPPEKGGDESGRMSEHDLRGGITLLNVWASWCVGCRAEHETLKQLAADPRLRLMGLNYKDRPADARRWLEFYGDPFRAVAVDADGRVGMDYGVYGVPETFVIDGAGVIRLRHVGPLDERAVREEILPLVGALQGASG